MIILPQQGLGFIAVTKCASTSIEAALKGYDVFATGGTAGLKHLPYRHVEKFVLPLLDAFDMKRPHFFAVVRHPAARVLSWYNFRTRENIENKKNTRNTTRHVGDLSLEEFVDLAIAGKKGPYGRVKPQHKYLTDAKDNVAVQTLIKIEYLDELLPGFLARFGIEMAAAPTRRNISPTTVTGNMPEDLVRKIVSSTRFGLDMELYDQGIATLS